MGFKDEIKQQSKDAYRYKNGPINSYSPVVNNSDGYRMNDQAIDSVVGYIKDIFKYKIERLDFHNDGIWGKFYVVRLELLIYLDNRGVFPDYEITRGSTSGRINNCDGSVILTFHNVEDLERILSAIVTQSRKEFDEIGNMGVDVSTKTLWTDKIISNFIRNIKNNVNYEYVSGTMASNVRSKSFVKAHFDSRIFCNRKGVIK